MNEKEAARSAALSDYLDRRDDIDPKACGLCFTHGFDAGYDAGRAVDNGWVRTDEGLPEPKDGWEHSEQCLVWYQPTEDAVGNYGIAYYHYNSPYQGAGWIDFAHLGRTPTHWRKIVPPEEQP